ncbi:MAG: Asp-tRNA(Asn)/Glu-tRNA(Gln) amidotransferase subunit GatB [Deltaproteobacteria bacterium]|jgi:aspartyl-tRNA(Asn)/glutamyl-tRNA(Gln) amidotransferase subunit B|nr:Asp-tRNA(Asn)/Glu-tRNA(Gln) amidotransferase subunit GatB [Deltaproteobacteria bacterium]
MEYEPVIGLEVHAQLLTQSKIFCSCSTRFGEEPNTLTCPVCTGSPGSLPVLNKKVVEYTLRAALATHCRIASYSLFARKNYFYPDLPKGYQISQYELPLTVAGYIDIQIDSQKKRIGIIRIHMEEDAGKLLHDLSTESGARSYVDFNRTGVPLIEIVSAPDIRTPEEAASYLRKLRAILMFLDICDGNMEEGSFRCDANISLRPKGREALGVKTELKNMNSFRNVQRALDFEIRRQTALLDQGEKIVQETRLWDTAKGVTSSMRGKEEAHDYRYFPDPDLIPLVIDSQWIEEIRASLPELPESKKERFIREYGIPEYDAEVLTTSKPLANYYEVCLRHYPKPKIVSNWIMSELLRELKKDEREIEECPVPALHLSELLKLIAEGTISGKIAKSVFEEMYRSGKRAEEIVLAEGWVQVSDAAELEKIVEQVLVTNSKEVEAYRKGKEKLFGFFVGQVMKATQGKANPQMVNEILKKKL